MNQSPLLEELVKQQLGIAPRDPKEVFDQNSLTILVLGCDQDLGHTYSLAYRQRMKREFERTGVRPHISKDVGKSSARADMILVARLDFTTNEITGLSIPRDLEVELPGWRADKINAYYAKAEKGLEKEMMRAAVEHTLRGVRIDRVVVLDYDAFQDVVDMVGGVPVNVTRDMKYIDVGADLFINLKEGQQVLDGYNAMGFVRFRHDDSDFERQKRQKELMVALKQRILSSANLKSLPQILEQSKKVLGQALTDREIAGLAGFAQKVPPENIKMGMVPIREQRGRTELLLDEDKLAETLVEYNFFPIGSSIGGYR